MSDARPEPVHSPAGSIELYWGRIVHRLEGAYERLRQSAQPGRRPINVNALVTTVQQEFPSARIRARGGRRTVERQAELMAQRRRQDRAQFLPTYRPAPHITEMDNWVATHPNAADQETTAAFTEIINRARRNGAVVSNHLSDRARDISIPHRNRELQHRVRAHLQELGRHVIDEHDAVGGPHWHFDY